MKHEGIPNVGGLYYGTSPQCFGVSSMRCILAGSLAVLLLVLASGPLWAQAAGGLAEISGNVRDTSGAVVPNAQVEVENAAKGIHVALSTSSGGVFDAPSLAPADGYTVTITKQGFQTYKVNDIELLVGQNLGLDIQLSLAATAAQVQVVATAPLVDDTKSDVSQVIGSQQILNLPINGRRVDSFVLLTPGVTNDGNYGLLTFRGVANGNTFLLDGNDSTEQFYVENNGRTRITSQISLDAVQEFQVVSSNYSAQYGRAMGGIVNTVTRSGSNDLHGSLFWFFRNQDMMARDPYTPVGINPDQWRIQSGFSVGGPIIKDKLFFFLNGDFTRNDFPLYDSLTSKPAYVNAAGATPTFVGCGVAGSGLPAATAAQCSAINALLPPYFGLIPRTVDQDLGFARIDYNLSAKNMFSFSFNMMHFKSPNGLQQTIATSTSGAGISGNGNDYGRVRNGRASWTYIPTANLVNQFRYGVNTDLEGDNPSSSLLNALGLLNVCVGSTGSCSSGVALGAIDYLPRVEPNETRNEFADDVSLTHGKHIFKFGVDLATVSDFSIYLPNLNGQYNYLNANAFALEFTGNTSGTKDFRSFTQSFGNAALTTRINDYDFYAEDQWRVNDRLTATLGLRYEYEHLPPPPVCNPNYTPTCNPINSPNTNLMPRVGLAYRLGDKTVVRAGYGLFYSRMAGATLQDLFTTGNGVTVSSISLSTTNTNQKNAAPVYPNILKAAPTGLASTTALQFTAPNFSTPYSEQGSLAVERQLTSNLGLTVSYLWSRGIHLYSVTDVNMPSATTNFTYTIDDINGNKVGTYTTPVTLGQGGVSGARPNPNFGAIDEDGNAVSSYYNGLVVQLDKRFSHGLLADVSYTWSHEIDDGQGYGQATSNLYLSNNFAWLDNGNFRADMGDGEEDQPQRLAISWVWQPTFTKGTSSFDRYVVNNWEFSSITTINSARPYGSASTNITDTPVPGMFSNFSLNGTGLSGRPPFWPVNSVWQPALYRDDIRASKILPFGDRYRVYLNFEVFNISNSWSPTSMTEGSAYTEKGGVLTPTPANYGVGSGDAWPIDGTEARRLQVSARFTF